MSGPFPGMDPWLEDPHLWAGVHTSLTTYARDELQPQLTPRYVAAIEERVYLSTAEEVIVPDVSIRRSQGPALSPTVAALAPDQPRIVQIVPDDVHEPYITILDLKNNQKVVTVIEFVSPSNKKKGNGRKSYLKKQREVLRSDASLVEIDLLRAAGIRWQSPSGKSQYRARTTTTSVSAKLGSGPTGSIFISGNFATGCRAWRSPSSLATAT